jgi:hypothetical protein
MPIDWCDRAHVRATGSGAPICSAERAAPRSRRTQAVQGVRCGEGEASHATVCGRHAGHATCVPKPKNARDAARTPAGALADVPLERVAGSSTMAAP